MIFCFWWQWFFVHLIISFYFVPKVFSEEVRSLKFTNERDRGVLDLPTSKSEKVCGINSIIKCFTTMKNYNDIINCKIIVHLKFLKDQAAKLSYLKSNFYQNVIIVIYKWLKTLTRVTSSRSSSSRISAKAAVMLVWKSFHLKQNCSVPILKLGSQH